MRGPALLAVAALHGVLVAAVWTGRPMPGPAARRDMSVTLLPPAPVATRGAVQVIPVAPPTPRLPVPVMPVIAPPAFDVLAADARPAPEGDVVAAAPAAPVPALPPHPPRADIASAEPALQPARRAACAPAPHPLALRERGIEGVVRLRVWVDELGHAGQVLLAGSSGWRLFDDAAMAQARRCPFQPALRGSQPVGSWVEFPVRFALETSHG